MERVTSEISRLLADGEFESIEAMNAFLGSQLAGMRLDGAPEDEPKDPLRRAQDLMYQAWETRDPRERTRLAERALRLSPDCADAYNLLAEEKARSLGEARAYFEKGVEAGDRALGPATFEEHAGHFWGLVQTRPYMRARAGLAGCLWLLGEEDEALEHWEDMLRLNPNDNQGIRETLLTSLLKRGEQERAGDLLERYAEDASAHWLYSRALWLYREHAASGEADEALIEALEQNEHVPAYLLGERKPPRHSPDYVGWGDEREAQAYALDAIALWKETNGARGWLLDPRVERMR